MLDADAANNAALQYEELLLYVSPLLDASTGTAVFNDIFYRRSDSLFVASGVSIALGALTIFEGHRAYVRGGFTTKALDINDWTGH
jgi:hypothetical protein